MPSSKLRFFWFLSPFLLAYLCSFLLCFAHHIFSFSFCVSDKFVKVRNSFFLLICLSACFAREIALVLQVFRLCRWLFAHFTLLSHRRSSLYLDFVFVCNALCLTHRTSHKKTYNVTALQYNVVTCMYFCTADTLHTLILVRQFHPCRPSPNCILALIQLTLQII